MKKLLALVIILLMLPTSKVLAADTPKTDNSKENIWESRDNDSLSKRYDQCRKMSNTEWTGDLGNKDLYGHNKEDGTFELTGLMNELFFDIKDMLPGDSSTKDIRIYNSSDKSYTLSFDAYRFDNQMPKEGEIDLLDVINLKITKTFKGATETIFNGKIFDENTNAQVIKLGTIEPNQDPILFEATVTMDPKAGNEYKNKEAEISWIFRAEGDENPPDNPQDPPNPSVTPVDLNSNSSKGQYIGNVSKTGDYNHLIIYALLALGSLLIGYMLFSKGKKRRKEQ